MSNELLFVGLFCGLLFGIFVGMVIAPVQIERSNQKDLTLLRYLLSRGESYGLDLVKAGHGKRGTIYVDLHMLENRGLLVSREDEDISPERLALRGNRPRRLYKITTVGEAALLVDAAARRAKEES